MEFNPENDGIDHINIYSKGKTELGRILSNFAHTPFNLPDDGKFESLEGYWYWLLCDSSEKEELRNLYGWQAKEKGKLLLSDKLSKYSSNDDEFKNKIYNAILAKIEQNDIKKLIEESTLPFDHYYVYNEEMVRTKYDWLVKAFEKIRREIKYSPLPTEIDLF